MDITMRIVIIKNQYRGWSVTTYTRYPDWPSEVTTGTGYRTLKSTLWHTILDCIDLGAKLLSLTRALADGVLAYRLNDVRKLLEVTNE